MSVTPIVALDVSSIEDALELVQQLSPKCRFFKVGSELFTAAGPRIVTTLRETGCEVFLDIKLHDIPNTVRRSAEAAASMGVSLLTVHASGGEAMIRAAVEGASPRCRILAVTVLTSLDGPMLSAIWNTPPSDLSDSVLRLSTIARDAHAAGVVCSGHEASMLRATFGRSMRLLVPGIRLPGSPMDDQSRTVTPAEAAAAGASYIILGRTVTQAPDPCAAMQAAIESVQLGGGTVSVT